jgi:glycosyltransferase involved in cell wall biosynthesis
MMQYIVDITICVFNHEKFLDQTFKGMLEQKMDFNFTIIVSDDCSQHNSSEIIRKYANEFSQLAFPFFQKHNLQVSKNSEFVFSKCTTKYVALNHGDDYWTDPLKLQKRIDYLEKNLMFRFVFALITFYNTNFQWK